MLLYVVQTYADILMLLDFLGSQMCYLTLTRSFGLPPLVGYLLCHMFNDKILFLSTAVLSFLQLFGSFECIDSLLLSYDLVHNLGMPFALADVNVLWRFYPGAIKIKTLVTSNDNVVRLFTIKC